MVFEVHLWFFITFLKDVCKHKCVKSHLPRACDYFFISLIQVEVFGRALRRGEFEKMPADQQKESSDRVMEAMKRMREDRQRRENAANQP